MFEPSNSNAPSTVDVPTVPSSKHKSPSSFSNPNVVDASVVIISETIPFTVAVYVMIHLYLQSILLDLLNVPLCVSDIDTEYCLFVTFKYST